MPKFAIDSLMSIDSPRRDGNSPAPLMRTNFHVPGLMEMQTPRADADSMYEVRLFLSLSGLVLSLGSLELAYDETPGS